MTIEQIERFIGNNQNNSGSYSKIFFKTRSTFEGVFIEAPDYSELKKKNFWRIVNANKVEEYRRSKDIGLSRIFSGTEFTRLAANNA